jgi:hypothetical protein
MAQCVLDVFLCIDDFSLHGPYALVRTGTSGAGADIKNSACFRFTHFALFKIF